MRAHHGRYLLHPVSYIHQEHVESGTRTYEAIAAATRRALAVDRDHLAALATKHTQAICTDAPGAFPVLRLWSAVRLRDALFPVFARVFHELVFKSPCPDAVVQLVCASGQNVIDALKCTTTRDLPCRARLTDHVLGRVEAGAADWLFDADAPLTPREKALHIQAWSRCCCYCCCC